MKQFTLSIMAGEGCLVERGPFWKTWQTHWRVKRTLYCFCFVWKSTKRWIPWYLDLPMIFHFFAYKLRVDLLCYLFGNCFLSSTRIMIYVAPSLFQKIQLWEDLGVIWARGQTGTFFRFPPPMYRIKWFETQKQCKKYQERSTFARQENVYWVPATSFLCLSARLTVRGGTG